MAETKSTLFVVDGATDVTGGLISAARQAELTRDVIDTTIVLPGLKEIPPEISGSFARLVRLPIHSLRWSLFSVAWYLPTLCIASIQLLRELRKQHCTQLQLNDFHLAHGSVLRLLGFRGRIVTWVRIDPQRFGTIGRIWLWLARWSSDELVAVSNFIAGRLPVGYEATLVYDAIPPVLDSRSAVGRQFLFVGNYIEGKGQDDAIRAFHLIADRFPQTELVFHGSDMGLDKNSDYRAKLEQLAGDGPGRDRIHLREFVKEPAALYKHAFAALNFSHSESFSLTCLEASAHGLAVAATRCGGPDEIISDGITGYLVEVGDVQAMAARMSDLLEDPERAQAMGEAGRRLVNERFSIAAFRRQIFAIFNVDGAPSHARFSRK